MVKTNFSYSIFLFKEITKGLFDTTNNLFCEISVNICENSFLNSLKNFSFPKSMAETYSEPSRTATMELFAKTVLGYFRKKAPF